MGKFDQKILYENKYFQLKKYVFVPKDLIKCRFKQSGKKSLHSAGTDFILVFFFFFNIV